MCESNGLGVLVDAFILLKKDDRWKDVKLILTGGSTGDDDQFNKNIRKKISEAGIHDDVEFHKDFEEEGRLEFLKEISILSVPVLEGEAFGLYQLEAMASGIPVVQPALGAFPEIVEKSGGGVIYEPNKPEELASALVDLLGNPEKLSALSKAGKDGIIQKFNIHNQALETIELYKKITDSKNKNSDAA